MVTIPSWTLLKRIHDTETGLSDCDGLNNENLKKVITQLKKDAQKPDEKDRLLIFWGMVAIVCSFFIDLLATLYAKAECM